MLLVVPESRLRSAFPWVYLLEALQVSVLLWKAPAAPHDHIGRGLASRLGRLHHLSSVKEYVPMLSAVQPFNRNTKARNKRNLPSK